MEPRHHAEDAAIAQQSREALQQDARIMHMFNHLAARDKVVPGIKQDLVRMKQRVVRCGRESGFCQQLRERRHRPATEVQTARSRPQRLSQRVREPPQERQVTLIVRIVPVLLITKRLGECGGSGDGMQEYQSARIASQIHALTVGEKLRRTVAAQWAVDALRLMGPGHFQGRSLHAAQVRASGKTTSRPNGIAAPQRWHAPYSPRSMRSIASVSNESRACSRLCRSALSC